MLHEKHSGNSRARLHRELIVTANTSKRIVLDHKLVKTHRSPDDRGLWLKQAITDKISPRYKTGTGNVKLEIGDILQGPTHFHREISARHSSRNPSINRAMTPHGGPFLAAASRTSTTTTASIATLTNITASWHGNLVEPNTQRVKLARALGECPFSGGVRHLELR